MNKKTIENILRFLERTELKWNEVPAFVECINALTSFANDIKKDNIKKEDETSK